MKDDAHRRVREAAEDARSGDDLVGAWWEAEEEPTTPIDEETLDERHSTQLGEQFDERRRDAN